jgi:hypothetical protein
MDAEGDVFIVAVTAEDALLMQPLAVTAYK